MVMKLIGEGLIYLVGLPLLAFQTFEGLHALIQVFGEIAQYTNFK
jgi:hypothetical protein